jgi:drug/metabolite transporter (DMT)-like permease
VVFLIGGAAAIFLGVGWVIQQRVATNSKSGGVLSWTVLIELVTSWFWWGGIAAMTVGQTLSSLALQFGPLSSVEPVLVGSLLIAFLFSALTAHGRPQWQELTGPTILIAALIVFLTVSDPREGEGIDPRWQAVAVAAGATAVVAAVCAGSAKVVGKRIGQVAECVLLAAAAGVMYALQDAATRGSIVYTQHHSWVALFATAWPWILLAAATAGVLLTQAAFRAQRLDWALPPTVASQPIAGVIFGVVLLGDRLSAGGVALLFEALCLVAMLGSVVLIGRSPAMQN